jgi:hypothetical protein
MLNDLKVRNSNIQNRRIFSAFAWTLLDSLRRRAYAVLARRIMILTLRVGPRSGHIEKYPRDVAMQFNRLCSAGV